MKKTKPVKKARVVKRRRVHKKNEISNKWDPTIKILNNGPKPCVKISRTNYYQSTFSVPVSSGAFGRSIVFDPSGTYGSVALGGGALAMPDWTSFVSCFDQYKVHKIIIDMIGFDSNNLAGSQATLFYRYNEDSVTSFSLAALQQYDRLHQKTFTVDHPTAQYSFTPVVEAELYNGGILSAQGRHVQKMGWCDVQNPVQLYGFVFGMVLGTDATSSILFNVTYDIEFKYSK